jgi:putative aminopeptidase FrvX
MNIRELFLELTTRTYPSGTEDEIFHLLPQGIIRDFSGNYFIEIGDSQTIFTSHLDTHGDTVHPINHRFSGDLILSDGNTILGADDKAGVSLMMWMIHHKVPGLYYFFRSEEVGCLGSKEIAKEMNLSNWKRIVSFDRRGYSSVVTHQSFIRTCSDDFAQSLVQKLNRHGLEYKLDTQGVSSDSYSFIDNICECTNLSVGYQNEHLTNESQDIRFLDLLATSLIRIDWEDLPTQRKPRQREWIGQSQIKPSDYKAPQKSSKSSQKVSVDSKKSKKFSKRLNLFGSSKESGFWTR